jgi:hypothetical protein
MAQCCNRHGIWGFRITLLPYPPDILHPALARCGIFALARRHAPDVAVKAASVAAVVLERAPSARHAGCESYPCRAWPDLGLSGTFLAVLLAGHPACPGARSLPKPGKRSILACLF